MVIVVRFIDNAIDALRFKDTIFYKENSDLQDRYNALKKLNNEYPNNENIQNELYIVKKGLDGENEISYQLKKAHIGMYVLRDIKIKYKDLTAQIDYVVITPIYVYYIECKNLVGNITVDEKGDFIREYTYNGRKNKKGMYSPLRQVEAQREVLRKIWEADASAVTKLLASKKFEYYRRVLVVAANEDTILNTRRAPYDIKNKILRADALVRHLEYDYANKKKDEYIRSRKEMEAIAESYCDLLSKENRNYYELYKNTFCSSKEKESDDKLKERLIEFRKSRASEMSIPAYYVFTNDELEKLILVRPKTIEELKASKILTPIKEKTHGEKIIDEVNKLA